MDLWAGERATGERVLLYTYVRRVRAPALERRYTLILPAEGPAADAHAEGLLAADEPTRAIWDPVLTPAHLPPRFLYFQVGLQHHHQEDADALGIIDPGDARAAARPARVVHDPVRARSRGGAHNSLRFCRKRPSITSHRPARL